jgi:hypothetical protein
VIEIGCSVHQKYRAIKAPTVACKACALLYWLRGHGTLDLDTCDMYDALDGLITESR